jgi:hypothetical protein
MRSLPRTATLCALVLWLAACEKSHPAAPSPAPAMAAPLPAVPPAPDRQAAAGMVVTGKVLETMDSGGYTYVRIAAANREQWAAVQEAKVAVGDTVTVSNAMVMRDFESKTLGRTFDEILFGTLGGGVAAPPTNPHEGGVGGGASRAGATGKLSLDAPVARAEGATGRTIAEVFAQKAALASKPVAVRGKVTKFNADIMGKNWVHLQDGSGETGHNDFDLTVTTSSVAAVGDVVVARGVVRTDQDFGAGYAYAVLVEDATLEK